MTNLTACTALFEQGVFWMILLVILAVMAVMMALEMNVYFDMYEYSMYKRTPSDVGAFWLRCTRRSLESFDDKSW